MVKLLVVDTSGVFAVPENTVRESKVLEEADIAATFDESIDGWQRHWQLDQDISDSTDESRLSIGSSASATTESDGDGGVSPTTSVEEAYDDEEVTGWSAILND